jgi:alkyl hydroperoxide reductase subunit AhpC
LPEFERYNTQVLGISVDSIPCHQAWQKSLGGITYPLLSDQWPYGEVCRKYGVMTKSGYSERVIIIVDREGIIRDIDVVGLANIPDNSRTMAQLAKIQGR